jgi:ribokinase
VDGAGERTITVIGKRLAPMAWDPWPWGAVSNCDGVLISAADPGAVALCRRAEGLTATPRLRWPVLEASEVTLDALIGSALGPAEIVPAGALTRTPRLRVATEGSAGGWSVVETIALGARCGAGCAGVFGPYAAQGAAERPSWGGALNSPR